MTGNSLLFCQSVLLVLGLTTLYFAWVSTHLMKKIGNWVLFQLDIVLLWSTALSRYHGQINPFCLSILVVILLASLGLLSLFLMLALGVRKRFGSLETMRGLGGKA